MPVRREVTERVRKALAFEAPDRVPVWDSLENAAVYGHFAPGVPFPECAAVACAKLGIDATYGCMKPATWRSTDSSQVVAGDTVWQTQPMFRSLDDLRAFAPPRINLPAVEEQTLAAHAAAQRLYEPDTLYLPQNGGWGFLPGYDTETFTVVAMALAEDPGLLERFWNYRAECAFARNSVTAKHRLAPVVQCCEDVAYKTGLMVSPELLRQHFFPRFRRVIQPLKEAGIKVIWHSDGDIRSVLDDAIACGIDGINPIERAAGMDLGRIRERYGRRLVLVGSVDTHTLRFGSEAEVRQTVRDCIRAGGGTGHLLQCDSGEIMPDAPLENVIAYLDEAHRFGAGAG